jgi:hypothetical protein
MITKGIIDLLVNLLIVLAHLLPDYTPPPAADLGAFQIIAWIVPINEIIGFASIMATLAIASLTYFGFNWVINKGLHSG